MASALRQAIRYKLSPEEEAAIGQRYHRFRNSGPGTPLENELAAYYRRTRRRELGISNIANADPGQIAELRRAHLIGYHPGSPGFPATVGGPTSDGSAELDPSRRMAGAVVPGLAGQQPMADATTGGVAPPLAATPVVPNAMAGGSPLAVAIRDAASAYGDRSVQKPQRRRPLYGGGGGGGG